MNLPSSSIVTASPVTVKSPRMPSPIMPGLHAVWYVPGSPSCTIELALQPGGDVLHLAHHPLALAVDVELGDLGAVVGDDEGVRAGSAFGARQLARGVGRVDGDLVRARSIAVAESVFSDSLACAAGQRQTASTAARGATASGRMRAFTWSTFRVSGERQVGSVESRRSGCRGRLRSGAGTRQHDDEVGQPRRSAAARSASGVTLKMPWMTSPYQVDQLNQHVMSKALALRPGSQPTVCSAPTP